MKEITLDSLTQAEKNAAEQLLVDLIRTKYPHLDIRRGTALRDLLVTPDAALYAWFSAQASEQRSVASLQALLERANAGEKIDTDDVSRVLSNFNLSGTIGASAKGSVRVVVSAARSYVVPEDFVFTTSDGVEFKTKKAYSVNEQPIGDELKLFKGTANYYFILPVVSVSTGISGNIVTGTVLTPTTALSGFVSAYAYGDFSGGAETEDLESVKARIPVALSNRGLLTSNSVEACLRDRFDSSDNPIVAVSVVGYGNPAMLRDRHNPFGVGVGGRADIYVRNFTAPYTETVHKDFTFNPVNGLYEADLAVPGMYSVQSVTDPEGTASTSYVYTVEYTSDVDVSSFHDIDVSTSVAELAGTVWRSCRIRVEASDTSEQTRSFRVVAICLPMARELQNYVDDETIRNVGCDYVVRCPAVCRVSVNVNLRYKFGTGFDVLAAKTAIANYINTTGFVGRLTRSEIACVLTGLGAKSVDIDDDYMLTGYVVDARGVTHKLSGDSLDLDDISYPDSLLTRDTCVFSTAIENINVVATPE